MRSHPVQKGLRSHSSGQSGCLWRINTEADFQALQEKARPSQRSQWQ